jgi:hypothetical protein
MSEKLDLQKFRINMASWKSTVERKPCIVCRKLISSKHIAQHLRIKHKIGSKRKYNLSLKGRIELEDSDPTKDYYVEVRLRKLVKEQYGKVPQT